MSVTHVQSSLELWLAITSTFTYIRDLHLSERKLILFSNSLGGWVATRASGMKKNTYGNIEDLVVRVRMVTGRTDDPVITLERGSLVPRASCGPDFDHMILGSEGTLGVVTEVVIKIRPLPRVVRYGSIVFPNFQSGVHAFREVRISLYCITSAAFEWPIKREDRVSFT